MSHPDFTLLEEALSPHRVLLTRATSKEEVLHTLIDHLADCGQVDDLEALRSAIFARESLMSTGIGIGIGVPHARISSVREMILMVAVNETPLADYESIDGTPVQLIFMVAGRPDQQSKYVRLLAVISHLVKEEERRKALLAADSPEALFRCLQSSS